MWTKPSEVEATALMACLSRPFAYLPAHVSDF